jgi:APA family basic amino acid/polyamine antiporter
VSAGGRSPQQAQSTARHALRRCLGPRDAAALIIANVIGVGIFTTPGTVASMVSHPIGVLTVWLLGGVLAFAGAMAYAELAVRYPSAGGEYVYLKESYGPLMGFLSGWTSFVAGFSGAIAAASVACATLLGRFVPFAADSHSLFDVSFGGTALWSITPRTLVAISMILCVSAVNIAGVHAGKVVQNTLTMVKLLALGAVIVIGAVSGNGSFQHFMSGEPIRIGTWAAAMVPVMFSYSGWNAATYVVEEIRDPSKNVPRALMMGTLTVVAIYVALNAVYLYAFPLQSFVSVRVGEMAAARLLGGWAGVGFAVVTIVIILSSLSAMVLAGPRVYFKMAQDRLFFQSAATIHPRFRTPHVATIAQALWASILVLSGTFDQLLMYTGIAVILFSAIAVSSLFVTRRTEARASFSAWGYPIAPAFFCVVSLLIVANALREQPAVVLTGTAIIASGIPLYWWLTRRTREADASPSLPPAPALLDPEL